MSRKQKKVVGATLTIPPPVEVNGKMVHRVELRPEWLDIIIDAIRKSHHHRRGLFVFDHRNKPDVVVASQSRSETAIEDAVRGLYDSFLELLPTDQADIWRERYILTLDVSCRYTYEELEMKFNRSIHVIRSLAKKAHDTLLGCRVATKRWNPLSRKQEWVIFTKKK